AGPPSPWSRRGLLISGPAVLDVGGDLLGGPVTAEPLDHAGPERPTTDRVRHQVRPVVAEHVRRRDDLRRLPGDVVRVLVGVEGGVRGEPPAAGGPGPA